MIEPFMSVIMHMQDGGALADFAATKRCVK